MRQGRPFPNPGIPMRRHLGLLGVLLLAVSAYFGCTRPELIGSDLLSNEASDIVFTDTLTLQCSVLRDDAVKTFGETVGPVITRSLVGQLDDPYFGKTSAEVFSEMFLFNASSAFLGRQIDSVVLTLRYDTLGNYGDIDQEVRFSVFRMEEELTGDESLYSDYAPMTGMTPIGERTVVPNPYDSLYVISRLDSVRVPAQLRIPMSQAFIDDMIAQDSSTFESADSFRMWLKGINVRMTSGENTLVGFDMGNVYSTMTVYFQNGVDTLGSAIYFVFIDGLGTGIHHSHFTHDYTGSVVQQALDQPEFTDSLVFIQGMAGVNLGISIPGLTNLNNILINKADLEFYAANLPTDDLDLYPRVRQLVNGTEDEEGDIVSSQDVNLSLRYVGSLAGFGGALTSVDTSATLQKYTMNITASLQDIYKGADENAFLVIPFSKASNPNRVILCGPGHPQYPARLKLTYTLVK